MMEISDKKLYSLLMAETPCYVIDSEKIEDNCKKLADIAGKTGAKILLAEKAFSFYPLYPLIGKYLAGTTASGLYEAKLGAEEMGKETHIFSPAYKEKDMPFISKICDHIIFNSTAQLKKYRDYCLSGKSGRINKLGLRINPELSTQEGHAIYDPCAPGSRLGVTSERLASDIEADRDSLDGVTGFHFHTLCEQGAEPLYETVEAVEMKFGRYFKHLDWINFGGGHHITRKDYNVDLLIRIINYFRDKYKFEVYIEPGEAVALDAGYLVTTVLDKTENNGITNLILDASAACHMPDVLEMPYRPPILDGMEPGKGKYTYRLGSCTCLAGDVIGDYSFDREINIGDKLIFGDMAIYSFVKNNTFNGMPLPDIDVIDGDGKLTVNKKFGYEDFKMRLGK